MVKESEILRIRELLERHPKGLTIEDVSQKLSMNRGTAGKYLNLLVASGKAEMRSLGPAKLFSLSQRVPLSQMLSFSSNMILILDSDLFVMEVNDAFLRYFSLERQAILGVQINHSALARYLTDRYMDLLHTVLEVGTEISDEEIKIDDTGHILQMRILPLVFDRGSKGIGIIFETVAGMRKRPEILEDNVSDSELLVRANAELEERIREHRKMEKALFESEERYRSFVENIPDAIFALNDQGVISFISPPIRHIIGFEPHELLGHPLQDHVYGDDLIIFTRGMEDSHHGIETPFELRLLSKEGRQRWIRISGRSIIRQSVAVGYQGVITDLHERKTIENALRQANRKLVLLNSITRHDILNGIFKINASLDLLQEQTKNRKILEIVGDERAIMKDIERQILFTRDYQNIGIRPPQWVNVTEIIRTVAMGVNFGKIVLSVNVGNLEIYADDLIGKVFLHLIENSVQQDKSVTAITISSEKQGRNLKIICEDNGDGIPEAEKELIFQHTPSGQVHYGLFLAREVLAITGITIRELGIPGEGTRFEILVPGEMFRGATEP